MTTIDYRIHIDAPVEDVFHLLTDAAGLQRWMANHAIVDARPGGVLQWTHENGATMVGRFIEIEPPHRVVFAYGWEHDLMGVSPESTTVEIVLNEAAGGTDLRLSHRGLPEDARPDHEAGWIHFFGELAEIAGSG